MDFGACATVRHGTRMDYPNPFNTHSSTLAGGSVQTKQASSKKVYDAIIIGSGASGGMAAKELTGRGFEVLLLEAWPPIDPKRDFAMNKFSYESMYRGFGPPGWKANEQWQQDTAGEFSRH